MPKDIPKLKIFYVEGDAEEIPAQKAALEKSGFSVEQGVGRKAAEQALPNAAFQLVILGHTLSKDDRHHLAYLAKKKNSGTRVLVLHASGNHPQVDAAIDSRKGPQAILETISGMFQKAATAGK